MFRIFYKYVFFYYIGIILVEFFYFSKEFLPFAAYIFIESI